MHEQVLPAIDVIRAATINAAELLGISKTTSSIKKGKIADLIAVYGDPLTDISVLNKVNFVMKQGLIVKQTNSLHAPLPRISIRTRSTKSLLISFLNPPQILETSM